jgi:hypothetical protein
MRNLKQVRHPSGPARRAARIKARASSEESEAVSSRHELLLQGWACAFTGATITYVSGPISTGPRFVEWYRAAGHLLERESQKYKKALRTFVIEPNSRDIIDAAVRLRRELREPVLEPASLNVSDWSASDYHALWVQVIERFAERIVVMPGWEYSAGCAAELHRAFTRGVRVETLEGLELTLETAANALRLSAEELERERVPVPLVLEKSIALTRLYRSRLSRPEPLHTIEDDAPKDVALNILAELINVAQFISFSPRANRKSEQRFSRILGHSPNAKFTNHLLALEKLLETSGSGSINLPSYTPADPQSREFIYGLRSIDDAVSAFERLANEGLWIIANETIDVHDGGVSGVIMGDVIEFAPDDTPRSVERPGITSLPREQGLAILGTVYGFSPDLNVPRASRLEFSIHPMPCGWRRGHTLGWEFAAVDPSVLFGRTASVKCLETRFLGC